MDTISEETGILDDVDSLFEGLTSLQEESGEPTTQRKELFYTVLEAEEPAREVAYPDLMWT